MNLIKTILRICFSSRSKTLLDDLARRIDWKLINANWSVDCAPFELGRMRAEGVRDTLQEVKEWLIEKGYRWPSSQKARGV